MEPEKEVEIQNMNTKDFETWKMGQVPLFASCGVLVRDYYQCNTHPHVLLILKHIGSFLRELDRKKAIHQWKELSSFCHAVHETIQEIMGSAIPLAINHLH